MSEFKNAVDDRVRNKVCSLLDNGDCSPQDSWNSISTSLLNDYFLHNLVAESDCAKLEMFLNYFLQVKDINVVHESVAKFYEEIKIQNIEIPEIVDATIQKFLVDLRFYSNEIENTDDLRSFEAIIQRIDLTTTLINEVNIAHDDELILILRHVIKNLRVLKHLLLHTYEILPWEEIEFCLIMFTNIQLEPNDSDVIYKIVLEKRNLLFYLNTFGKQLMSLKYSLAPKDLKRKFKLIDRNKYVSNIKANNPEFVNLYNDFEIIRDFYSLSKIKNYLEVALARTTDPKSVTGKLIIQRTLQVIGEYLKNTPTSPNTSNHVSNLLISTCPKHVKKLLNGLRDDLSKAKSLTRKMFLEKQESDYFVVVREDLKKIHTGIAYILYKIRSDCLKLFYKKITECVNLDEFLKSFTAFDFNTGIVDSDEKNIDLGRLEVVIQNLLENVNETAKRNIEKMMKELQRYKSNENDRNLLYQSQMKNAKAHFLTVQIDFEYFKRFLRVELENLKLISNAKKQFMDEMLFSAFDMIDSVGVESYHLICEVICLILGIDTIDTIEDFRIDLKGTDEEAFGESSISDIFLYIENGFREIETAKEFRKAIIAKQRKYLLKQKLKDHFNENYVDKESLSTHLKDFQDLPESKKLLATFEKDGYEVCKNFILKIDDPYGLLLKQLSELNALSIEKYKSAIITFTKSLKLKAAAKSDLETNLEAFASNTAKQYFCERLDILQSLIKNKNVAQLLNDPSTLCAIEMLLLDLTEILANFGCFQDATFIVDQHSPVLIGKSLRNYLAHGDALFDILPTGSTIGVVVNALKFVAEGEKLLQVRNKWIGAKLFRCQNILIENKISIRGITEWVDFCRSEFSEKKIKHKLQPKIRDSLKRTGLHFAAHHNEIKTFEYLLNFHDIYVKDVNYFEPAFYAVLADSRDVIKFILDRKLIDVHYKGWNGKTIAHVAIIAGKNFDLFVENIKNIDVTDSEGSTLLHDAIRKGNISAVKTLVEKGADLRKQTNKGLGPLHYAASNGFCDIISFLLEHNVDVDVRSSTGNTPLHCALFCRKYEAARLLVDRGANVNAEDDDKVTPLKCILGSNEDNEMIVYLLKHGADVKIGLPLHFAILKNRSDLLELFLDYGALVDVIDTLGNGVLHEAARSPNPQLIEILLQKQLNANQQNKVGFTPLHVAALEGNTKIAETLLSHNANVDARTPKETTPLHLSAEKDRLETFKLLASNGADINAVNSNGITPFLSAAKYGANNIFEELLKNDDVNLKATAKGVSALHLAAAAGHEKTVKLLLTKKEIFEGITDEDGETPLHLAARNNHPNILKLLLNEGFHVDQRSSFGNTALHVASAKGNYECVKVLIERKSDLDAINNDGFTPIHFAALLGQKYIVIILMQSGANLSNNSSEIASPQMSAARMCHTNILKLLPYDPRAICWAGNDSCFEFLFQQRKNQPSALQATSEFLIIGSVVANNLIALKNLIALDFNVNFVIDDLCPLHISIKHNYDEIFEFLLQNNADVNILCQNITPLHLAVTLNSDEKVKALLKFGANCNTKALFSLTPLHCAIRSASQKIIEKLIKAGSDIEAKDADGVTPLQFAVRFRSEDVVDLLLQYGCNVTSMNNHSSVLHEAVSGGNAEIVRKIIRGFGVDDFYENLDVQDSTGDTPLMWAIETKKIELIVELLRFGAKPWIKNAMGMDCFDWARQVEDVKILSVLFIYCEKLV